MQRDERLIGSQPIWLGPDREGNSIIVEGDRIVAFGEIDEVAGIDVLRLDCAGCVLRSGRVNAHTHLYSGLVPLGMPPPEPAPRGFIEILERVWWRLDRALDRSILRAAARHHVAEALLAGTTALVDHHESPAAIERSLDVLADACQELGMRAVLCYGATERNDGRREARRGLAEGVRFIGANRRPLVRGVLGLHAAFTVSDDTIREAGEMCRQLGTVLHVHLAEDLADLEDAQRLGYDGPLERLAALRALPPGSLLAHGVHLERQQVAQVNALGCWLVQNPRSNAHNRVGDPAALAHAERVAVGTDGFPADMAAEAQALRAAAARQGEGEEECARRLRGGAALAGERFGLRLAPLAEGTVADLGAFGPEGGVRHLLVGGRLVVRGGKLVAADRDEIRTEAREEAARLWARMRAL